MLNVYSLYYLNVRLSRLGLNRNKLINVFYVKLITSEVLLKCDILKHFLVTA